MIGGFSKSKNVWGLYVGESGISAVKVSQKSKSLSVEAFETIDFSEIDSSGTKEAETESKIQFKKFPIDETVSKEDTPGLNISDLVVLIEKALNLFLTGNEINSADKILVSLPSQFVLSRFVNLPVVAKNQIKGIVRFEVEKHIPLNIKEIIWDYHILTDKISPGKELEVGIFAIKKEDIYTFLSSLKQINNNLTTVQTGSIALYNFLSFNNQTVDPTLLMEVGSENTNLMIIDNDKFWIRNVPSADLGGTLVEEIKRSVGYYKSLVKEIEIKYLIVAGNIAQHDEKKNFIAKSLGYELRDITIKDGFGISDNVDKEKFYSNLSSLSIPLGLAIQGLSFGQINTNLVPEEFARKIALSGKKKMVSFSTFAILISIIILFSGQKMENKRLQNFSGSELNTLGKADRLKKKFNQTSKEYDEVKIKLDKITSVGQGRTFWFNVLPMVLDSLPKGLKLNDLNTRWIMYTAKGSTEKAIKMSLKGKSSDPRLGFIEENIKASLEKLSINDKDNKEIPFFTEVEIVQESIKQDDEGILFEITGIVKLDIFLSIKTNHSVNN